jgi:hypothetical protein
MHSLDTSIEVFDYMFKAANSLWLKQRVTVISRFTPSEHWKAMLLTPYKLLRNILCRAVSRVDGCNRGCFETDKSSLLMRAGQGQQH